MSARSGQAYIFNALAVRDTNPATGNANVTVSVNGTQRVLVINNSLNQAGNYQVQYSYDGGTTFTNLGTSQALSANSDLSFVTQIRASTVQPINGIFKITYTASVAPASGSLTMALQSLYI